MIAMNGAIGEQWRAAGIPERLADWTLDRLVNRRDVWGEYKPAGKRTDGSNAWTMPGKKDRGQRSLEVSDLVRHFEGRDAGHIVGLHSTSESNTSKWFAIDIDAHDDDSNGQANIDAALAWFTHLCGIGFSPLLFDSDGSGGYHLLVLFSDPVDTHIVYRFAQSVIADYGKYGLAGKPETFPKQPEAERYGNWLRLPGMHHTRTEHFTRVFDGDRWLDGLQAIESILCHQGDSPALIPPDTRQAPRNGHQKSNGKQYTDDDRQKATEALWGLNPSRAENYDEWLRVGQILHAIGTDLVSEWCQWSSQSKKFDRAVCLEKWETFNSGVANAAGLGTLIKWARDDGWKGPQSSTTGPAPKDDRPMITVTTNERTVNQAAVRALSRESGLFQRASRLVHVVNDRGGEAKGVNRPAGLPKIMPVPIAVLREMMAANARWITVSPAKDRTEERPTHPPKWSVEAIHAYAQWRGIRHLEQVVSTPILRPDGTVLQQIGYDSSTGILLELDCTYPKIHDQSSQQDAGFAADELTETIIDFPFVSRAHASTWLAAVLTTLARPAIAGPCPMFCFDAPVGGSGKSLLADCVAIITTGRTIARTSAPPKDDEMRKRITTIVSEGCPVILLDNITRTVDYASLDAALTGITWTDRLLKTNKSTGELPLITVWLASGNNVALGSDTARRVLFSRIEPMMERPEERSEFKHVDLLGWVRQERPRLVSAGLTILRAYCAAGRPDMEIKPWGSFEAWSGLVRSSILFARHPDPCETKIDPTTTGDNESLAHFMAACAAIDPQSAGLTVSEIVQQAEANTDFRETLLAFCPPRRAEKPSPTAIGHRLRAAKRRVIGGRYFDSETRRGKPALWRVVST